jgi:hypothetical protein
MAGTSGTLALAELNIFKIGLPKDSIIYFIFSILKELIQFSFFQNPFEL